MFSVMLCDKESKIKILEDFSYNEQKVEIPNFQTEPNARCAAEEKWKEKIAADCLERK
jgi:hypothetical protein